MTATTVDLHASAPAAAETAALGFFDRLIDARLRQGKARVSGYLMRQSDETLAGLGFSAEQIAAIRRTGEIPHSFWR